MALSERHKHALTTNLHTFVENLYVTDTMLAFLRSQYVLTEEMNNEIQAKKLSFYWIVTKTM